MPSDIPGEGPGRILPSGGATPDRQPKGSRRPRPAKRKPFAEEPGPSQREDRVSLSGRGPGGEHQDGAGPEPEGHRSPSEGGDEPFTDIPGRIIDVTV